MLTYKEVIKIFEEKYPKLTVMYILSYDTKYYILNAIEDPNKISYSDPFYSIEKSTGKIGGYNPTTELDKFAKLARNNMLWRREE